MNYDKFKEKVKTFFKPVEKPLLTEDQISTIHSKFEYLHFNKKLSLKQLNTIGDNGWELVSHSAVANDRAFAQYYVFKRIKK